MPAPGQQKWFVQKDGAEDFPTASIHEDVDRRQHDRRHAECPAQYVFTHDHFLHAETVRGQRTNPLLQSHDGADNRNMSRILQFDA